MAWDGAGNFNRLYNWVADEAANIDILPDRMDAEFDGIVTGLENCVTRDGQNTPSANLPMGNRKHTGVANATALTDYATADQVVKNSLCYGGTSAAGTDTYAVSLPISPVSYAVGRRYSFKADVANTGACTINFNTIGAASIKNMNGTDPASNSIIANQIVELIYDGTNMILLNPAYNGVQTLGTVEANKTVTANAGGNITFDTSSVTQYIRYNNGSIEIRMHGDTTTGDFVIYDFTNMRNIIYYDESLNRTTTDPSLEANGGIKTPSLTAIATNGDLNLARNGTGDITVDSVPIYGLVVLDTPVQLLNNGSTTGSWQQLDMSAVYSAAATAGATKAILRITNIVSVGIAADLTGIVYIRKRGSGLSPNDTTRVTYAHSPNALLATDMTETVVNLDSNSDFDWYQTATGGSALLDIIIVGYYV